MFQIDKVLVYNKENEIIMVGRQVPSNGLCMVDLTDSETEDGFKDKSILNLACNMVGEERPQITIKGMATATVADQMAYLHACMYSPAPSAMTNAADLGFLSSFPGLTSEKNSKALAKVNRNNDGTPPTTEAEYAVNKTKGEEAQGEDE